MPVKNIKRRTNDMFEGAITGLTEEEKKVLDEAGIGSKTLEINLQDYMTESDFTALVMGIISQQDFSGKYNLTKSIASAEYDQIKVNIPANIAEEPTTFILTCYRASQGAVPMFMCNFDWNYVDRPVVFFALCSNDYNTDDLSIVSCIAKIQESASTIIRRY